jgi:transposase InsO family protein
MTVPLLNRLAAALSQVVQHRRAPQAITVDNGGEFVSRAMDAFGYAHDVRLDFIRPGKPVENAFIETSNSKLRDECLNNQVTRWARWCSPNDGSPAASTLTQQDVSPAQEIVEARRQCMSR